MSEDTNKKWDDSLISMGLGALVVVVSGILLFNYFNNQAPQFLKEQGEKSASVSSTMPREIGKISVSNSPGATATVKPTATPKVTTAEAKPTATSTQSPKATTLAKAETTQPSESKTLPANYTVQSGDSLWKLSEKFYGTGYEWKKLASANNISGSYNIATGQVISVPRIEQISATSTEKSQIAQASPAATNKPSATINPPATGGAGAVQSGSTAVTYTVVSGDNLWKIALNKCNNGYAWTSIAKQNNLRNPGVIHIGNTFTFTCSK